jgi:hypothetical protein
MLQVLVQVIIMIVYITTPPLPHGWFSLVGRQGVEGSRKVQRNTWRLQKQHISI